MGANFATRMLGDSPKWVFGVIPKMGFWGSKVPLPFGPSDGHEGLEKNYQYLYGDMI